LSIAHPSVGNVFQPTTAATFNNAFETVYSSIHFMINPFRRSPSGGLTPISIIDLKNRTSNPWFGHYMAVRTITGDAVSGTIGYAQVLREGRHYRIACCVLSDGTIATPRFWSKRQPDVLIAAEVDAATWVVSGTMLELAMSGGEPWATFPVPKVKRRRRTTASTRQQQIPELEPSWPSDDVFRFRD
jgi:hypothetical protein